MLKKTKEGIKIIKKMPKKEKSGIVHNAGVDFSIHDLFLDAFEIS